MQSAIDDMKKLTEEEMRDGASGLALAIALGEVTKALERVAIRMDKSDAKLDDMGNRIIRIEASSSSELAKESKTRIDKIEKEFNADLARESKLRIDVLEKEVAAWKTRGITAVAAITAFWAFFGEGVQTFIGQVVN